MTKPSREEIRRRNEERIVRYEGPPGPITSQFTKEQLRAGRGDIVVVHEVLDLVEDGARHGRTLSGVILGIAEHLTPEECRAVADKLAALASKNGH